jgi:hypothetical protein
MIKAELTGRIKGRIMTRVRVFILTITLVAGFGVGTVCLLAPSVAIAGCGKRC